MSWATPLLAYTLSVSQDPAVTTVSSTSGIGIWKSTLDPVSEGTFSEPPEVVPPPLESVPPVPSEFAVSFLPPSRFWEYQTPPPTIRAITTTADTTMASGAFDFLGPPGGMPGTAGAPGNWGCVG